MYPDTFLSKLVNAEGKNHQNIGKNNRKRLLVTVPDPTYQHSDVSTPIGSVHPLGHEQRKTGSGTSGMSLFVFLFPEICVLLSKSSNFSFYSTKGFWLRDKLMITSKPMRFGYRFVGEIIGDWRGGIITPH